MDISLDEFVDSKWNCGFDICLAFQIYECFFFKRDNGFELESFTNTIVLQAEDVIFKIFSVDFILFDVLSVSFNDFILFSFQ